MDGLVDDGFIVLGGPVGDGERGTAAPSPGEATERRWAHSAEGLNR